MLAAISTKSPRILATSSAAVSFLTAATAFTTTTTTTDCANNNKKQQQQRRTMSSFYSLTGIKSDGSIQKMDEFRGATRREYAQFKQLNERWDNNSKLIILAFPSREFGSQEYKTDAEIQEFASSKEFPGILMQLGKVCGDDASDIWKFFYQSTGAKEPNWNFKGKFLVSKDGKVSVPTGNLEDDIASLM